MLRRIPVIAAAFLAVGALGGCQIDRGGNPAFVASGEVIALGGGEGGAANACATCHGLKGEGDGRLAPRLAGLNAGYLHRQLDDYANGRREHKEMRAIVRRLSGKDRAYVSAYYASLPKPEATLPHVSELYLARCAQCHGDRGQGRGPANPPIAGLSPTYIEGQLLAWRSGKRRGDAMGEMIAVSRALSPGQIRDLAGLAAVPARPASPHPPPAPAAFR